LLTETGKYKKFPTDKDNNTNAIRVEVWTSSLGNKTNIMHRVVITLKTDA
jgi:hypothetical protein